MKTFSFPPKYIEDKSYNLLRQIIYKSRYYGPIEGEIRQKLVDFGAKIGIAEGQIVSIHHLLVKEKIVTSITRINKNIGKISDDYKQKSIIELSHKYDHPPLNLLRSIFIYNGYDPRDIYEAFAGREPPQKQFEGRDLAQFNLAAANDADTIINQREAARRAELNENLFVNFFRDAGCKLKTQNDLIAEQMQSHGRAVITPDLLFVEPVIINGAKVQWIDFKDYAGTPISFMLRSNVKQYKKYNQEYGNGLICYRYGIVKSIASKLGAIDCISMNISFVDSGANDEANAKDVKQINAKQINTKVGSDMMNINEANLNTKILLPKDAEWVVYGRIMCVWTQRALARLEGTGVVYVDLTDAPQYAKILAELTDNWETVPMIFHNGKFIGGFSALQKYFDEQ